MSIIEKILFFFIGLVVGFALWSISYEIYASHNQSTCLDLGYPSIEITLTYDVYCTGIDGATSSTVFKLGE